MFCFPALLVFPSQPLCLLGTQSALLQGYSRETEAGISEQNLTMVTALSDETSLDLIVICLFFGNVSVADHQFDFFILFVSNIQFTDLKSLKSRRSWRTSTRFLGRFDIIGTVGTLKKNKKKTSQTSIKSNPCINMYSQYVAFSI